MESVHSSVGDEHCSKVALPTIGPREMSEALGGEEDGVLGPDAGGVSCGCAGDSATGRQCRKQSSPKLCDLWDLTAGLQSWPTL